MCDVEAENHPFAGSTCWGRRARSLQLGAALCWLFLHLLGGGAAAESTAGRLRIVFGSCIAEPGAIPAHLITSLNPDLLILLGDTVYQGAAEYGQVRAIERLYAERFRHGPLREVVRSVRTLGIWDDHDFGPNNSDAAFAGRAASLAAFRRYFPRQRPAPPGLEAGIPYRFDRVGVTVLLTDNRTWRINPPSERAAMFGAGQLAWLEEELRQATSGTVIIASGSQLLSSSGDHESLRLFPAEESRLRQAIADSPARVVIISGDRHHAEILADRIGEQEVLEFTSSPLAAPLRPKRAVRPEKRRVAIFAGDVNIGVLDVRGDGSVEGAIHDRSGRRVLARSSGPTG